MAKVDHSIDLEVTRLPCGRDCGNFYSSPGLVEPAQIQRAALDAGWGIEELDDKRMLVCPRCQKRE